MVKAIVHLIRIGLVLLGAYTLGKLLADPVFREYWVNNSATFTQSPVEVMDSTVIYMDSIGD